MTWLTWRQHRVEGLWALILATLVGGSTAFLAYELSIALPHCPGLGGVGYCFSTDLFGRMAQAVVQFNLSQYGLVVLPALAGAFIGAPLVAREIENGTQRLLWTQGVTRLRWLLTKIPLVFLPVLAAAAIVGWLEVVLLNVQGPLVNRWNVFDQQAPMTIAATFFALALGVAFGALVGKSIPAMAFTLVAFVVVRVGIAELARPSFMAPQRLLTHDLTALGSQNSPTAWWIGQPDFYDSTGRLIGTGGAPASAHVSYAIQYFQPGDRFWPFQTIESAILAGLALLLLGFAIYWVTRRVS